MVIWFLTIAAAGTGAILQSPRILAAATLEEKAGMMSGQGAPATGDFEREAATDRAR